MAGAVVGAAGQAYAGSQLKSDAAAAQGLLPNVGPVEFDRWDLAPLSKGFDEYLGQGAYLKRLTKFAQRQNDAWAGILDKASPGILGSVKTAGRVIDNRINGELTAEEQANVTRSAAYRSLQQGFGADSKAGRALEARDLGLTTHQIQSEGISMLPQQMQTAGYLSPVAPHNLLLTPGQILQRIDTNDVFNTQTAQQEAAFNANLQLQQQAMAYNGAMTQAGLAYQANASTAQAIGSALGSVGNVFGGMSFGTATPPAPTSGGYYSSLGGAQQAAPFAGGFSRFGGGWVPMAARA